MVGGEKFDLIATLSFGSGREPVMRFATSRPRAGHAPLPVVAAPDGTWVGMPGLLGREIPALQDVLAGGPSDESLRPERLATGLGFECSCRR